MWQISKKATGPLPRGQRAETGLFCGNQVVVHRLTAAEQIHIRIGADIRKQICCLLGMLFLHIGAIVDGDILLAVVADLLCQRLPCAVFICLYCDRDIFDLRMRLIIVQPDIIRRKIIKIFDLRIQPECRRRKGLS